MQPISSQWPQIGSSINVSSIYEYRFVYISEYYTAMTMNVVAHINLGDSYQCEATHTEHKEYIAYNSTHSLKLYKDASVSLDRDQNLREEVRDWW